MEDEKIIQQAFNAGYLMEQHLPHLSELLREGFQDKTSPFAEGFIAGSGEFAKERDSSKFKFIERLRGEFGDTPAIDKDRHDKGMDIEI